MSNIEKRILSSREDLLKILSKKFIEVQNFIFSNPKVVHDDFETSGARLSARKRRALGKKT